MRLAVSILVLAMASAGVASYQLSGDWNGYDLDITVTSDGLDPDEYWILAIDSEGTLYDAALGPDAPSESFIYPGPIIQELLDLLPPGVDGFYGGFDAAPGEVKKSGTYLTASSSAELGATIYFYSFDESMTVTLEDQMPWVPEPSAFCVLVLGGLALLRKRRP